MNATQTAHFEAVNTKLEKAMRFVDELNDRKWSGQVPQALVAKAHNRVAALTFLSIRIATGK